MHRLTLLASLLALPYLTASAQEGPTDGLAVDGVILEPDGTPVVGAEVFVAQGAYFDNSARVLASTTTDAEGRFAMADVPVKDSKWAALVWLYGGALSSEPIQQGASQCLRLVTRPRGVAEGRIVGPDGRPIAGARLTPILVGPTRSYSRMERCDLPVEEVGGRLTVQTDADGRYRFDTLEPADIILFDIEAEGYTGLQATWRSTPNRAGMDATFGTATSNELALPETGTLRGVVVEPGGTPAAGRMVRAKTWALDLLCDAACVAAEDGSFEFVAMPCLPVGAPEPEEVEHRLGDYTVTVDATPDAEYRAPAVLATLEHEGETEVELALQRCITVSGTALDAGSRKPIAGVVVDAYYSRGRAVHDGPTTGPDGTFTFGVLPGANVRLADAPLQYSWPEQSTRPGQGELEPFLFEPARTLRGWVRDDRGRPVSSARVYTIGGPRHAGAWAVSREDGTFVMYRDRKAQFTELVAVRDDLASTIPVLVNPGDTDLDVEMVVVPTEPSRVRGRLLSADGAPLAYASVTILGGSDAVGIVARTRADETGAFETAPFHAFGPSVALEAWRPGMTGKARAEAEIEPGALVDLGDIHQGH